MGENDILSHLTDTALQEVSERGAQASDRAVLLACYGLAVRNMSEKIDRLRWPLWFAGGAIGASSMVQVLMKLLWGS